MIISLATLDRQIITPNLLVSNLYLAYINKSSTIIIDFLPEGSCAQSLNLYNILDNFCENTGFDKKNIFIKTANMLEHHSEYSVEKHAAAWYEVNEIQKWLKNKTINLEYSPKYHFANFISRTNWARLWIATILNVYYQDKTIQTYHHDLSHHNYNPLNEIGLDELVFRKFDLVDSATNFIKLCPKTLDLDYLQNLGNCKNSIFQHENSYYPIQHPKNLNLLQYYNNVFVDVVVEPNISGRCFLATEKIWRPIIARRPFIVMSNSNYLHNLKRLGFQTFDNFWSEEYDNYAEEDRIKSIEQLLQLIANWDNSKLANIILQMKDVLDHNYNTFINLKISTIRKVFGAQ